jgi:coenzyme PQQ synthesis protein D (PqqD)
MQIRQGILEWREVEGEIVALDLRSNTYLGINRTGTAVWSALVAGADREQLVRRLTQTFDVSEKQAAADLDAFLAELAEQDLLESA